MIFKVDCFKKERIRQDTYIVTMVVIRLKIYCLTQKSQMSFYSLGMAALHNRAIIGEFAHHQRRPTFVM